MIYWEHYNPRFLARLSNPLGLDYDVWQWEAPEGWLDVRDTDDTLEFSLSFSTDILCQQLRAIFRSADHTDQLVCYYYVEDGACLSVIATSDPRLLYGMSTQAPVWWSAEEGSPLQRLLERIKTFNESVSLYYRDTRTRYQYPAHLEAKVPGFCGRCGLPDEHHVSHSVPGFTGDLVFKTPAEARPYMEAFKQHYGGALKKLSDLELLMMPLPPNKRNLRLLTLEVQSRIDNPVEPASALDRLLADGGLLDE